METSMHTIANKITLLAEIRIANLHLKGHLI